MSDRIRFAPAPRPKRAAFKPDLSKIWPVAWRDFVRAALASADEPQIDYMRSKLRGECVDAIRSWTLPFAEGPNNQVLAALPYLVRAFCHQTTVRERAALAEPLRSLSLRCLELLGPETEAPAAPAPRPETVEALAGLDPETRSRSWRDRQDCGD
jgi:hypothetical protein